MNNENSLCLSIWNFEILLILKLCPKIAFDLYVSTSQTVFTGWIRFVLSPGRPPDYEHIYLWL